MWGRKKNVHTQKEKKMHCTIFDFNKKTNKKQKQN